METAEVIATVEGLYAESDRIVHDILSRIMSASGVETTGRTGRLGLIEAALARFST